MVSFGLFLNAGAQLERTHYDVWISEHYFTSFGANSNALTLAGFILGQTKRLRIGTAVEQRLKVETLYAATRAALRDALTTSFHAGDLQAATGAARFVLYMEAIAERETILRSVRACHGGHAVDGGGRECRRVGTLLSL